jgi:hypothetical protein
VRQACVVPGANAGVRHISVRRTHTIRQFSGNPYLKFVVLSHIDEDKVAPVPVQLSDLTRAKREIPHSHNVVLEQQMCAYLLAWCGDLVHLTSCPSVGADGAAM